MQLTCSYRGGGGGGGGGFPQSVPHKSTVTAKSMKQSMCKPIVHEWNVFNVTLHTCMFQLGLMYVGDIFSCYIQIYLS